MNLCLKRSNSEVEEVTYVDTHKSQRKKKVFRDRCRKHYGASEVDILLRKKLVSKEVI